MSEPKITKIADDKDYVMVHDRILKFNQDYPEGAIETVLLSLVESEHVLIKAIVTPDVKNNPSRRYTGHSAADYNYEDEYMKNALEIAETSAIGRALAAMGIGIISGVASADEIVKSQHTKGRKKEKAKANFNNIKDEDIRKEAESIAESLNGAETVEQLREFKELIKKSDLPKDAVDELIKVWNAKKKELDNA